MTRKDLCSTYLYYTEFTNVYALPAHHLLLRGVVGDLMDVVHNKAYMLLTSETEAVLRERGRCMSYTLELRDKYKCFVDAYRQYKMSDILHFCQYYSSLLFYKILLGD